MRRPELLEALRGEMTPKFLASRSADGEPNVVPWSPSARRRTSADTLHFGNFLLRKSIGTCKKTPGWASS